MTTENLLSPHQWDLLQPLFTPLSDKPHRGRPLADDRLVLEGILRIVTEQSPWNKLSSGYPSYITCFRRYNNWIKDGTWESILTTLYDDFTGRTGVDLCLSWEGWLEYDSLGGVQKINTPPELFTGQENYLVFMLFLREIQAMAEDDILRRVKA